MLAVNHSLHNEQALLVWARNGARAGASSRWS